MTRDKIIGSDNPLHGAQRRLLDLVLDLIIPASGDGRMPSAAEVDVLGYIREAEESLIPTLRDELDRLEAHAEGRHGLAFEALDADDRRSLVDEIRSTEPDFMHGLAVRTATCYYQDDRVLEALGMEARPPFPKGYEVVSGDLSLLDPVRARGKIWRDAPE